MKLKIPFFHLSKLFSIMIVFSVLVACSGPSAEDSGGDQNIVDQKGSMQLPKYLGFVVDSEDRGIAYAMVGGTEIATEDGVASGDFEEYEGQWIPVEAPGYASSFARTLVPLHDAHFFSSRLTQFQTMSGMEEDGDTLLSTSIEEDIALTIHISPDQFNQDGVIVGLAAIDLMDVAPGRVAHRSVEGLRLRNAFAIQAFVDFWDSVQLSPGATVPITIEFSSPLGDQAVFTTFDPVQGIWVEQDPGCSTEDGLMYSCQLPQLNPLWAIFDDKDNFMTSDNSMSISHPVGNSSPVFQEAGNPQEDFNLAYYAWKQYMLDNLDGPAFDFDSPALLTLLKNLEKAAKKFTKKNRTEAGKKVAIETSEAADWSGNETMSESFFEEAANIADEVFKKLINEVDCGEAKKLIKGSEQFQLLSGNEKLSDQASDKLNEITEECDIWVGYIRVIMKTTTDHPAELPLSGRGTGWWQEVHRVRIWTNINNPVEDNSNNYVMHINDKVQHIFPPVNYASYDPCKIEFTHTRGPGDVGINYEGFYDGVTFQINTTTTQGEGVWILQSWEFNSKDPEDDTCKLDYYDEFFWVPYFSQIVHGLTSDTPPIDLQEMLDEGEKGTSSLGETITGSEPFLNPDPELGIFPFREGIINWRFIHVEKKLPKPAE